MSDVSKIKIGSTSYDIADKRARDNIDSVETDMLDFVTSLSREISGKYDSSNVVKGSGTLTNGSDVSIRYSDYSYQKIDNIVTLEVHMYINPDRTIGNLIFDLPFRTTNQYNGVCISSINALYKWAIEDSTLTISKLDVQNEISKQWIHEKGEEFSFVVTYRT